jgi:hypothetical protein
MDTSFWVEAFEEERATQREDKLRPKPARQSSTLPGRNEERGEADSQAAVCPFRVLCHEHRRLIRGAQLYERCRRDLRHRELLSSKAMVVNDPL